MTYSQNSNYWSSGWVDWNLVLDINGGPNWAENYVDAPVIVSEVRQKPILLSLISKCKQKSTLIVFDQNIKYAINFRMD